VSLWRTTVRLEVEDWGVSDLLCVRPGDGC
jgi:hypothetical protein